LQRRGASRPCGERRCGATEGGDGGALSDLRVSRDRHQWVQDLFAGRLPLLHHRSARWPGPFGVDEVRLGLGVLPTSEASSPGWDDARAARMSGTDRMHGARQRAYGHSALVLWRAERRVLVQRFAAIRSGLLRWNRLGPLSVRRASPSYL